jgi:hypothetical protein
MNASQDIWNPSIQSTEALAWTKALLFCKQHLLDFIDLSISLALGNFINLNPFMNL